MSTKKDRLGQVLFGGLDPIAEIVPAPTSGNDEVDPDALYHGNSVDYWRAKALAYGGIIQELWAILGGADGKTDIRDAVRKQAAQIVELQTERAEILRISGLVWPPSAAIAKEGE